MSPPAGGEAGNGDEARAPPLSRRTSRAQADLAITMYKKARRHDAMVRLVGEHRPEVLKETHQFLAQQLEMDGSFRDAERHYVEAGEWLSAVNM